jgi:hypothetical protein
MNYVSATQSPANERYAALRAILPKLRKQLVSADPEERNNLARKINRIEAEIESLRRSG